MRIKETPEKIILSETPGCLWLFSGFFIAIGLMFVLGPWFFFSGRAGQPVYVTLLASILGLFSVMAGLWMINRSPRTVTTYDRLARVLRVNTWRLIGQNEGHWPVSEIAGLRVAEEKDSDGDPVYCLELALNSGEKVQLSVLMQGREKHMEYVQQICSLLKIKPL